MVARGGALAVACYKALGFILLIYCGDGLRGVAAFLCRGAGLCSSAGRGARRNAGEYRDPDFLGQQTIRWGVRFLAC